VGNFPPVWTEWNGKYRDTVRDFLRGEPATLSEFASRISGSADLYQDDGRRPFHSINFVTCHDGFTLADLVSYNDKHNDANGEENRDGEGHNRSWNCGVEGPTEDQGVLALRARQRRNFLATLLLSQGVPMIGHGDELGRTQHGNNNAYCQDNELAWVDWANVDEHLLDFVRTLSAFRARHQVFHRRRFFTGRPVHTRSADADIPDLAWYTPDGRQMTGEDWGNDFGRAIALFVNGDGIRERGQYGQRHRDSSFLLLFNAHDDALDFVLPGGEFGQKWERVVSTADPDPDEPTVIDTGGTVRVPDRCLVALERMV
jgi:isoamylase